MKQMTKVNRMVTAAICTALCVVLPIAFHAVPGLGSAFSPMHIPVLLCGLLCGSSYGLLCGIAGPVLSSVLTGMPGMIIELSVYGVVTGLAMKRIHTKTRYMDIYVSLITGMLLGRIAAGIVQAGIFSVGKYSLQMWLGSYFISAWPAIIMHIIVIPVLVISLEKAKLIYLR